MTKKNDEQTRDLREKDGAAGKEYQSVFVARQPIFDRRRRTVGSELLYRDSLDADGARFTDNTLATLKVVSNVGLCSIAGESGGLFINFSVKSIMENVPYALPTGRTVVEIEDSDDPEPDYVEALRKLKADGYPVALDGFQGRKSPLSGLADTIKLDVLGKGRDELEALVSRLSGTGAVLLAKRVEDEAAFDLCKSLGFTQFQGFFFKRPVIVPGRSLSSNEITRLKLFSALEQEEPDFTEMAEVIQADVSVSYRLLTLLNSASFGFPRRITSIQQALVLLGGRQLKNWLRLVILMDIMPSHKSSELAVLSTQRGKFLELVSLGAGLSESEANAFFLLGLFSLLEPMLDLPMAEVVDHLPLADDLRAALCGQENEYSPWLRMALDFESADWDALARDIRALKLDPVMAARSYHDSLEWTSAYFHQDD